MPPVAAAVSHNNATGGGANAAHPLDRVALYTFPSVTTATVTKDYGSSCSGTPTSVPYQTPLPATATYQVVNFSSDYRTSNAATTLNTTSNIVQAVGATSTATPCLKIPGGIDTFYAAAINQAQTDLITAQAAVPHSQNVMIILSDGDANSVCTTFGAGPTCTAGDFRQTLTTNGKYIGYFYMCQQAVTAADTAQLAGTTIYTVAYGAAAAGCASDNTTCPGASTADCVPTGKSTYPSITPCWTMGQMASSPSYFFSDYTSTGGTNTCIGTAQSTTNLNQIFAFIASELSVARLVPNGT